MEKIVIATLMGITLWIQSQAHADVVHLTTVANKATCEFMKECTITGNQDIEIINDSDQNHLYHYQYAICIDVDQCQVVNGNITVYTHTRWNNHHDSSIKRTFDRYNKHQVESDVYVSGTQIMNSKNTNDIIVG